jgi:cytochrome c oxidase subunit 1
MATATHAEGLNYINWEKGIWSWLTTIDHKRIGLMYLVTLMIFFAVGGVAALIMRTELAQTGGQFLTADQYNIMFTLHGVDDRRQGCRFSPLELA